MARDFEDELKAQGIDFLSPLDDDYSVERRVFNGAIDRHPRAILFPRKESDVERIVKIATSYNVRMTVRCGGHNIAGKSVQDDCILIDLRNFRYVRPSRDQMVASIGGGCLWGDVDRVIGPMRLAIPGGTVSTTGVGGLTLGGGIGWLLPSCGLASDQLLSIRMTDADGRTRLVDDVTDPELMACIRGAGHGLGIVTEFTFRLSEINDEFMAGSLLFQFRDSDDVLSRFIDLSDHLSDQLMVSPCFLFNSGELMLSVDVVSNGPGSRVQQFVNTLTSAVSPIGDSLRMTSWDTAQKMLDNPFRRNRAAYWKNSFGLEGEKPSVSEIIEAASAMPTRYCSLFIEHFHGAFHDPDLPSVFPLRSSSFDVLFNGSWVNKSSEGPVREWAREYSSRTFLRQSPVTYRNYADTDDIDTMKSTPFVVHIKQKMDPEHWFYS